MWFAFKDGRRIKNVKQTYSCNTSMCKAWKFIFFKKKKIRKENKKASENKVGVGGASKALLQCIKASFSLAFKLTNQMKFLTYNLTIYCACSDESFKCKLHHPPPPPPPPPFFLQNRGRGIRPMDSNETELNCI
jgi:hypothetical protein